LQPAEFAVADSSGYVYGQMNFLRRFAVGILFLACIACSRSHSQATTQTESVELQLQVSTPFHFVAYGDARFHDPKDTDAANAPVRQVLVQAIAQTNPAFISFSGDIVYNGYDTEDWKVWDSETAVWREKKIPVYPALGNHDLHGSEKIALSNYFQHFPELKNSVYYSVRFANALMLVLDSALDETSGPQGQWLKQKLDNLPGTVDFVFIVLHHPPYTSSSDMNILSGGHSARSQEKELARMLESRQQSQRARIVVFSGHVHNYERHEHGGVTYFVTGGAGAHPVLINRPKDDPFQSKDVNYHYLQVEVDRGSLKITMHRVELKGGTAVWTEPDSVRISVPAAKAAQGN
jgi:acid phosphatase type 7